MKTKKMVVYSAVLLLCVASGLWSSTTRMDWLHRWSRDEQIAYTRGVKDTLESVAFMTAHRVFDKTHAEVVADIARMGDLELWALLRFRSEPLLSGAIRGVILREYQKAFRE